MDMKKYLLLFCLTIITTSFAYSQSLTLSDSAGPIANNSTKLIYGSPSADEILSHVFVTNTTASTMRVKVKKVELAILEGTMNLLCWGLCFDPTVYVSPDPLDIAAGATNNADFSGHYIPGGVIGISTIRYVFFNDANPSDSVCFTVDYDTYPQSISKQSDIASTHAYPNPANNSVNFTCSVPQGSDAKLIIRNLLGTVVGDFDINGNSGKLNVNTSDLADGIYFYSVVLNGNPQFTKKLVVRH